MDISPLGNLTSGSAVLFLLLLTRTTAMLTSSPFFSNQSIPNRIKLLLGLGLSMVLFPLHAMAAPSQAALPTDLVQLSVMVAQELAIGLLLGFSASLVFNSLHMAGELLSMQMGLSVANVLDPATKTNVPLLGQLYFYFGVMVFLCLNLHHGLLLVLNASFKVLPLGDSWLLAGANHSHIAHSVFAHPGILVDRMLLLTGNIFVLGMLLALPVVGLLLITEIGLALVNRVMPQMNIFVVGLPIKIMVAILGMMLTVPSISNLLTDHYATTMGYVAHLLATR
jgi:flagellar biosynthesis protein FliR